MNSVPAGHLPVNSSDRKQLAAVPLGIKSSNKFDREHKIFANSRATVEPRQCSRLKWKFDDASSFSVTQHTCQFIVDGLAFLSVDQFLNHQREVYFATPGNGGFDRAEAILKVLKAEDIGKNRSTADSSPPGAWDKVKYYLLAIGLYAKFSQNTAMKYQLLATGSMRIAVLKNSGVMMGETERRHWSTGYSIDELPDHAVREWQRNMLGEGLMAVREYFLKGRGAVPTQDPANQREALIMCVHFWLRPHNYLGVSGIVDTTYYASDFAHFFARRRPLGNYKPVEPTKAHQQVGSSVPSQPSPPPSIPPAPSFPLVVPSQLPLPSSLGSSTPAFMQPSASGEAGLLIWH